jgi:hypothetical protein
MYLVADLLPHVTRRLQRLAQAREMLEQQPSRRFVAIADDALTNIPLTVLIRTSGGLLAGELVIDKRRWTAEAFFEFLAELDNPNAARPSPEPTD